FRRVLGDDQVQADVDQIGLGVEAVTLDCDRFAELYAHGDWPGAAALVEGDFLEGLSIPDASQFEDWLGGERVRWRAQSVDALVRHADGLLVLGEGEPGEGKTRLIEELVARARLDDATVAAARAVALDQEKEGSAIAGLLAAGLGDAPGLAGAPAGALAALGSLDPEVGARFVGPAPAVPLADAVRAAVVAAAQERPTLLALDDAQWIDAATLEALPA